MNDVNREQRLQCQGVSAGVAVGKVFRYEPLALNIPHRPFRGIDHEMKRFHNAREQAKLELIALQKVIKQRTDEETAAIFAGHIALVDDPMLTESVAATINAGFIVEVAVQSDTYNLAEMLEASGDDVIAERAADVRDIGNRILRILLGLPDTSFTALTEPSIIIARELTPTDTAMLNPYLALGICLVRGSELSHAAILARTIGIPAVIGLNDRAYETIMTGQEIAVNGTTGDVVIDPQKNTLREFHSVDRDEKRRTAELQQISQDDAYTIDNQRVEIFANVGDMDSVQQALSFGAEGIGLLRTEFIYMNRETMPAEEMQLAIYQKLFAPMGNKSITVRTFDLGGDKAPEFMQFPPEDNPYLGWRGIRISLDEAEMFKTQIKAILRAARGHNVRLMYPMIESVDTLRRANHLLNQARAELDASGIEYQREIVVGTMIETPAAALIIDHLARDCDFFSLGTNDLIQYTVATDRNNSKVANYFRPFNPAVLRLIHMVIQKAKQYDKPVSICGEVASNPLAVPIMMGMGVNNLSMVPNAIPLIKWIVKNFSQAEMQDMAQYVLQLDTATAIEKYLRGILANRGLL